MVAVQVAAAVGLLAALVGVAMWRERRQRQDGAHDARAPPKKLRHRKRAGGRWEAAPKEDLQEGLDDEIGSSGDEGEDADMDAEGDAEGGGVGDEEQASRAVDANRRRVAGREEQGRSQQKKERSRNGGNQPEVTEGSSRRAGASVSSRDERDAAGVPTAPRGKRGEATPSKKASKLAGGRSSGDRKNKKAADSTCSAMRLLEQPDGLGEAVEVDVLEQGRALALAHLDAKTLRELGL